MKAITVKQPWASLIVEGIKDIENRTWKTNFRGRVLIHAGVTPAKGWTKRDGGTYVLNDKQYFTVTGSDKFAEIFGSHLTFGAIIGSVEIVDCVINHPSIWAEKSHMLYDGFSPSEYDITYNWVLSNPILFDKPIPAKGKLSFWDYPNILAEPEEEGGKLYCHCQLPVDEEDQVWGSGGDYECRYCCGIWYK